MYSIVNLGEVKGLCDKPRYVKSKDGIYVECSKEDATHVAIKGTAYSLTETIVKEVDGAEFSFDESIQLNKTTNDVIDSQDALCILSEDMESRLADIENALCEISMN